MIRTLLIALTALMGFTPPDATAGSSGSFQILVTILRSDADYARSILDAAKGAEIPGVSTLHTASVTVARTDSIPAGRIGGVMAELAGKCEKAQIAEHTVPCDGRVPANLPTDGNLTVTAVFRAHHDAE